jgi:hypothetical protein
MPFFVAQLIGVGGNIQSLFMPPLLTTDQVLLLQKDNVVSKDAKDFKDFGIVPTAVESIVPGYLWRFKKNGQFAEVAKAS